MSAPAKIGGTAKAQSPIRQESPDTHILRIGPRVSDKIQRDPSLYDKEYVLRPIHAKSVSDKEHPAIITLPGGKEVYVTQADHDRYQIWNRHAEFGSSLEQTNKDGFEKAPQGKDHLPGLTAGQPQKPKDGYILDLRNYGSIHASKTRNEATGQVYPVRLAAEGESGKFSSVTGFVTREDYEKFASIPAGRYVDGREVKDGSKLVFTKTQAPRKLPEAPVAKAASAAKKIDVGEIDIVVKGPAKKKAPVPAAPKAMAPHAAPARKAAPSPKVAPAPKTTPTPKVTPAPKAAPAPRPAMPSEARKQQPAGKSHIDVGDSEIVAGPADRSPATPPPVLRPTVEDKKPPKSESVSLGELNRKIIGEGNMRSQRTSVKPGAAIIFDVPVKIVNGAVDLGYAVPRDGQDGKLVREITQPGPAMRTMAMEVRRAFARVVMNMSPEEKQAFLKTYESGQRSVRIEVKRLPQDSYAV